VKYAITIALSGLLMLATSGAGANRNELPMLGDRSSAMISPRQERELGREVLRMYRGQIPTSDDYQVIQYTEELLDRLAPHSELSDTNLSLIVVRNPNMNAFAAPGGIVGVNTGLFNFAQNEHQFVSVLAHELAHLSQRHYARRLQQQQNMSIPMYAGILGSLILMATTGTDAGMAGIMSTQAAALDAQLRFSRQFESEADRIGMQTMARADFDPREASRMFEQMLRASRFSQRPPEFLMTHPITERRVADTRSRAMNLVERQYDDNLEYHLMRSRTRVVHQSSPQVAVQRFEGELDGEVAPIEASRYGLAFAQMKAGHFDDAEKTIAKLLEDDPERLTYRLLEANIQTERSNHEKAIELLEALMEEHENQHALTMHYGLALMNAGQFEDSARVLNRHSRERSEDPQVWYWLAEVNGLAGDILGVHEARAEYFIQVGGYSQALQQLQNALRRAEDSTHTRIILRERIKQVEEMQRKAASL